VVNLSLGCAQFGMNYGFTNTRGQVNQDEVGEIIDLAIKNNIYSFDTAQSYGNSEEVLGKFLPKYSDIKITTKFLNTRNNFYEDKDVYSWEKNFQKSLNNLNTSRIDSFLIHNTNDLKKNGKEILEEWLNSLIERKLINRLGISIYSASDLYNISLKRFGLIQMPISLYDQRLIKNKTCQELFNKDIAIQARSILFQGLLFINYKKWPNAISEKFKSHHSRFLNQLNKESILELTLNFLNNYKFIESALIGVTCLEELKQIITIKNNLNCIKKNFFDFAWDKDSDLDPRLW
tara:strand:+ start:1887 stop:2759 length:873 start_codon:yes stop_codon:yes gene_type:complete